MKRRSFLAMLGLAPAVGAVGAQVASTPNELLGDTVARSNLATIDVSGADARVADEIVRAVKGHIEWLDQSQRQRLARFEAAISDPHARG